MDKSNDKRHFHRILYAADATLTSADINLSCRVIDLSLKGCLLQFDCAWNADSVDTLYTLKLKLSNTIEITMQLSVSHVIGNEVGFKCEHIDIDSISQLRRLLELNLGDSTLLERDLLALSGIQ
jgi:hypothetical protein